MTIQELHDRIDEGLNNLNSRLYGNILSAQKDLYLNIAQERFIKQRYGSNSNRKLNGFEMSQKRIDDLRNLVTSNEGTCYTTTETNRLRYSFPSDYMFLVNQRSKVRYKACYPALTKTSTVTAEYVWYIPLYTDAVDYTSFDIITDPGAISIMNATFLALTSSYPSGSEDTFAQLIIDNVTNGSYLIYYETYKTFYKKGYLIVKWNGIGIPASTDDLKVSETIYTDEGYSTTVITAAGTLSEYRPNRWGQQDDVFQMQNDPFNKTYAKQPLTVINSNFIDVFVDSTFTVESILLYYIRKPLNVSLTLQQGIELAEHTHQEIVDIAVNLLIETLESKRLSTESPIMLSDE